ncbi:MAG: sulfatase-like hydrolase/transferase [Promethearchaeota archaeon]
MPKPNIVFLLMDHQAFYGHGEMAGGPKIQRPNFDKLASEGVEFTRAYTCCPLCAPARRSMLNGLFPHKHGELTNFSFREFKYETYLEKLAEEGYKNYYFGKWHAGPGTALDHKCEGFCYPDYNNPYTKPEYKEYLEKNNLPHFQVRIKHNFMDSESTMWKNLNVKVVEGELHKIEGAAMNEHCTGVMTTPKETHEAFFLANLACNKLKEIAESGGDKPFHLRVDFWGPHQPYYATQEFIDLYPPETIPEYPSFRDDLKNKPKIYKSEYNYPLHKTGRIIIPNPLPWSKWQEVCAMNYAQQSLIDEAAGLIFKALDELGLSDNTFVIWTTDHGDGLASHGGHFDKDSYMPEEIVRIPMAVRYPGVVPSGQKSKKLVSNLDIGPTFLTLAGTSFDHPIDGRDFLPIITNKDAKWEEDLMCETQGHYSVHLGRLIVTDRYKYIMNERDMDELYDIQEDPFELNNLINKEKYAEILADMKSRLKKWRERTSDTMTIRDVRKDRVRFIRENADKTTLVNLE